MEQQELQDLNAAIGKLGGFAKGIEGLLAIARIVKSAEQLDQLVRERSRRAEELQAECALLDRRLDEANARLQGAKDELAVTRRDSEATKAAADQYRLEQLDAIKEEARGIAEASARDLEEFAKAKQRLQLELTDLQERRMSEERKLTEVQAKIEKVKEDARLALS